MIRDGSTAQREEERRGPPEAQTENQFWHFRGPRGHALPSDMSSSQEMACPSFSNGSFVHSGHTWLPVVALGPRALEGGCRKHWSAKSQGQGPRENQISKNVFGTLEDPEVMRTPPTCHVSREMVCPSFYNGSFAYSVHTWLPVAALDPRWLVPEAPRSAKRKGQGSGRLKSQKRFWRFRGPRGHAHPTGGPQMVCPSFSNG